MMSQYSHNGHIMFFRVALSHTLACLALLSGVVIVGISCATQPLSDEKEYSISLSINEEGVDTASFSNNPISLLVKSKKAFRVDSLQWWSGSAAFLRDPFQGSTDMVTTVEADIYWDHLPLSKDTNGRYFDTIFVEMRGGIDRSNLVTVFVDNIPPVLKRVTVNTDSVDGIYAKVMTQKLDSLGTYTIQAVISDVYKTGNLSVTWASSRDISWNRYGQLINYRTPDEMFVDTLSMFIYDGAGGDLRKKLVLSFLGPNTVPVIDSIRMDTALFASSGNSSFTYQRTFFDTLQGRLFVTDADNDRLTITWTSLRGKSGSIISGTDSARIVYACAGAGCTDTLTDTVVAVDTLLAIVDDGRNGRDSAKVALLHGAFGNAPEIDSIRIGDSTYGAPEMLSWTAMPDDSIDLRVWAHDADAGDSLVYSWTKASHDSVAVLTRVADVLARYAAPANAYADTIIIQVRDKKNSDTAHIAISTKAALTIDTVTVVTPDSIYAITSFGAPDSVPVSGGDSLVMRVGINDAYLLGQTSVRWSNTNAAVTMSRSDSARIDYLCVNSTSSDTITLSVTDSIGTADTVSFIIAVLNAVPELDSIVITKPAETGMFAAGNTIIEDSVTGAASITIKAHAHDNDVPDGDVLSYSWLFQGTEIATVDSIVYASRNDTYADTFTVVVADQAATTDSQHIAIIVTQSP
ncbi:MAG: hypothetical protein GF398_10835 [Chitinivibrionales bacterium]|nr:hypothetical protein [Chitinivibrionales bacterium]